MNFTVIVVYSILWYRILGLGLFVKSFKHVQRSFLVSYSIYSGLLLSERVYIGAGGNVCEEMSLGTGSNRAKESGVFPKREAI